MTGPTSAEASWAVRAPIIAVAVAASFAVAAVEVAVAVWRRRR